MKEIIAELRAAAQRLREGAQHADLASDYEAKMRLADLRDQEADALEAKLLTEQGPL